ncbi:MAG: c-type cytochrome [Pseudomonadota bacterium]
MNKIFLATLVPVALLIQTPHAMAEDGMALAKKSGCLACHALDKTIVGPAWNDVAEKYKNDPEAHTKLVQSVLTGSSGKWGSKVHMKAQNQVPQEDVSKLVDYILSLKK